MLCESTGDSVGRWVGWRADEYRRIRVGEENLVDRLDEGLCLS